MLTVQYYYSTAERLPNSTGNKKKRVALAGLDSHKYLIAYDTIINQPQPPKLGFLAKKRFFIVKTADNQYVKINKNSFCKRFQVDKATLEHEIKMSDEEFSAFLLECVRSKTSPLVYAPLHIDEIDLPSASTPSTIEVDNTNNQEINLKIYEKALVLVGESGRIFWIPHPLFTSSEGAFPHYEMHIEQVYGARKCVFVFGKELTMKLLEEQNTANHFLEWLNLGDEEAELFQRINDSEKGPIFMNCTDFFYLILFQAGLVNKQQITAIYEEERKRQVEKREGPKFYGIDTTYFAEELSSIQVKGKPGDVIVGFQNNVPVHIMIYGKQGHGVEPLE